MLSPTNPLPLTIRLGNVAGDNAVLCENLLRYLPGKRLVCRGSWQERHVVIKLFLDSRSARRHWSRELEGAKALKDAQLATPEILFAGFLDDKTPILMFDWLPKSQTALEVLQDWEHAEQNTELLGKLAKVIAGLHDAGLVQEDLHLDNFLVSDRKVYAIDGQAISTRKIGRALNLTASSRNLAVFFSQFPPKLDCLTETLVEYYADQRKISAALILARLKADLQKARRKRRYKYIRKSYRSCSEFVRSQQLGQFMVFRRDAHGDPLEHFLADPDCFMSQGTCLKAGKSATVMRVQGPDYDWVIKRYNIKTYWHAISRLFRPTRAWTSWGNAHRLKISGIATPRAVAMIEKRFGPLRSTGYYVCDYIAGPHAGTFFQDETVPFSAKQQVAAEFVFLFDLFRKLGIHHGDCKATNFLLRDNIPWVLDLDVMRECLSHARFKSLYKVDRQRFLNNWKSLPEWLRWFDEHLAK
jgi:tRNA A-37 threonylcarbamoyl transferase component Bud32